MYILVNKFSDTFLGKNLEVELLDLRSFSLLNNISNFIFYAKWKRKAIYILP